MATPGGGFRFIGRGGMGARGRIQRMKTHVIPFTDHAGKEALMVFQGRETCPLPPLFSFAMYFTHSEVNTENVQPTELLDTIRRGTPLRSYPCPFRLEIYFLYPSDGEAVSDDACIAHYSNEKRRRGDYTRQINAIDASVGSRTDIDANLPGFVPSYIDSPISDYHNGLLYHYRGANWLTDKQPARCIRFDPIPQEKYAPIAAETGEPEFLPPVHVTLHEMQESDADGSGALFLGLHMYDRSYGKTENETNEPWQEAVERGWSTW